MNFIWQSGIVNPMTNFLLVLYNLLFNNFFVALIAFTAITRLIMLPLNIRQQRSMAKTQEIQPQIQEIQKKYRNDPQKMQEEFARIGYNPAESLAGCLPLLIQMPIFFGLYRAITFTLATTPQGLYELSERAYDWVNLTELLPVDNQFLWLNLAQPDPWFLLPLLVGGTMYIQQKLLTPQRKDTGKKKKSAEPDVTAQTQQMMQVYMPVMFGFFAMQFPAGLSVYFVISNLIGMIQGYYMRRSRENDKKNAPKRKAPSADLAASADSASKAAAPSKSKSKESKKETKAAAAQSKNKRSKQKTLNTERDVFGSAPTIGSSKNNSGQASSGKQNKRRRRS